jgi:hypothetical protein
MSRLGRSGDKFQRKISRSAGGPGKVLRVLHYLTARQNAKPVTGFGGHVPTRRF